MKKKSILTHILLPAVLSLLLVIPLTCVIFRTLARDFAYKEAEQNLTLLQKNVLPLMHTYFSSEQEHQSPESVRLFLLQLSELTKKTENKAEILVLSQDMNVIFPHTETAAASVDPLAALIVDYIEEQTTEFSTMTARLTNSGSQYLIQIYRIPYRGKQLKYLITYCSTEFIDQWVNTAVSLVLAGSSFIGLLMIFIFYLCARGITQPLAQLAKTSAWIGEGHFQTLDSPFSIKELELLRLSMNQMSEQLRQNELQQQHFFQNVSHDLRTPLMSISGYAQGIEQGVFKDPIPAASTILEESSRLSELVNQLLTLSRIENISQTQKKKEPLALAPCLQSYIDRYQCLARRHDLTLTVLPFPQNLLVFGNKELLLQVVDNLLSNALRYARREIILRIDLKNEDVLLQVLDDGDGISEQDLPHLFDRCYKGKGGNFGIGLTIAKTASERMQGSLTADNRPEGGAIFTLTLKQAQCSSPQKT